MANTDDTKDISTALNGVVAVMCGDMGIKKIIKNDQVIYQRQSSYFYLELYNAED